MFQRLLVPLDGGPRSAVALRMARVLGEPSVAEVTLLRVIPDGAPSHRVNAEDFGAAADYLSKVADELRVRPLTVWTAVRRGDVLHEIQTAASDARVDLIVLATDLDETAEPPRLGSLARALAAARCGALMLVPAGGPRPKTVDSVAVVLNGSATPASGLGAAANVARLLRARILVLCLQPAGTDAEQAEAHAALQARRLARSGLAASGRVLTGDLSALAAATSAAGADLIAVSQPHSAEDSVGFDADLAGLLAAARLPVLIA